MERKLHDVSVGGPRAFDLAPHPRERIDIVFTTGEKSAARRNGNALFGREGPMDQESKGCKR